MPETDPLRVLVVDDDPSALVLLARYLTGAGYEVLTAANGVEAMRVLMTEGAPIVITDWVMPEMNGLELCRAIRKHEGIPFAFVIIITARWTADDRLVEAFNAGADDYLCKPYKPKELLARLRAGERIVRLQREVDNRNREAHRQNAEIEIAYRKLAAANERLDRMASTDELTGLVNRREAMVRLGDCWASVDRHGGPLACIALDIDHFKSVNDRYGHAVGDSVLKKTAKVLRASTRREEAVCRIGGEELLIICPRSTEAMAAVAAERLRKAVEANTIQHGDSTVRVTISAGVAQRTSDTKNPDDLLRAADSALYAAKDAGRNTVRLAGTADRQPPVDDSLHGFGVTVAGNDPSRAAPGEAPEALLADDDRTQHALD